jgi:hypothetical protein
VLVVGTAGFEPATPCSQLEIPLETAAALAVTRPDAQAIPSVAEVQTLLARGGPPAGS